MHRGKRVFEGRISTVFSDNASRISHRITHGKMDWRGLGKIAKQGTDHYQPDEWTRLELNGKARQKLDKGADGQDQPTTPKRAQLESYQALKESTRKGAHGGGEEDAITSVWASFDDGEDGGMEREMCVLDGWVNGWVDGVRASQSVSRW